MPTGDNTLMILAVEAFKAAVESHLEAGSNIKGAAMILTTLRQEHSTMALSFVSGFEADRMAVLRDLLVLSTQVAQALDSPEAEEIIAGLKRACFAHPLITVQSVVSELVVDSMGSGGGV